MFTLHRMQQSTGVVPEPKLPSKLVVLCAFDRDEEGVLQPAFEPRVPKVSTSLWKPRVS